MTRVLIIVVSRTISNSNNNNLLTIKKNLIDSLRSKNTVVDLCSVLSTSMKLPTNTDSSKGQNYRFRIRGITPEINYNYKKILGNFKYEFICREPQLRKVCYIFNTIKYDEYDWYIKIRPEINLLDKITIERLESYSKEKINARCRDYEGPAINLEYGFSISNSSKWIKYNNNYTIINPDDQIYFFHKNIATQAFAPLSLQTYLGYVEKLKTQTNKPCWIQRWMLLDNYFGKTSNKECEGHHQFIWNNRNICINPISLNLHMNSFHSGRLKNFK